LLKSSNKKAKGGDLQKHSDATGYQQKKTREDIPCSNRESLNFRLEITIFFVGFLILAALSALSKQLISLCQL
jgi:hypothetical protein